MRYSELGAFPTMNTLIRELRDLWEGGFDKKTAYAMLHIPSAKISIIGSIADIKWNEWNKLFNAH